MQYASSVRRTDCNLAFKIGVGILCSQADNYCNPVRLNKHICGQVLISQCYVTRGLLIATYHVMVRMGKDGAGAILNCSDDRQTCWTKVSNSKWSAQVDKHFSKFYIRSRINCHVLSLHLVQYYYDDEPLWKIWMKYKWHMQKHRWAFLSDDNVMPVWIRWTIHLYYVIALFLYLENLATLNAMLNLNCLIFASTHPGCLHNNTHMIIWLFLHLENVQIQR